MEWFIAIHLCIRAKSARFPQSRVIEHWVSECVRVRVISRKINGQSFLELPRNGFDPQFAMRVCVRVFCAPLQLWIVYDAGMQNQAHAATAFTSLHFVLFIS